MKINANCRKRVIRPLFQFPHQSVEVGVQVLFKHLMLTLSTPTAPRFRRTDRQASNTSLEVIRPVRLWTLIFPLATCFLLLILRIVRSSDSSRQVLEGVS